MLAEDNKMEVMLFKETRDYEKISNQLPYKNHSKTLLGRTYLADGHIEYYIDNIQKHRYKTIERENKDLIRLVKKYKDDAAITEDELYASFDEEVYESMPRDIDIVVLHELTHRLSGYAHPKKYIKYMEWILGADGPDRKPPYPPGHMMLEDEELGKTFLNSRKIMTYTTKDFNDVLEKAIDWYHDGDNSDARAYIARIH